jgi:hypothetical protein
MPEAQKAPFDAEMPRCASAAVSCTGAGLLLFLALMLHAVL